MAHPLPPAHRALQALLEHPCPTQIEEPVVGIPRSSRTAIFLLPSPVPHISSTFLLLFLYSPPICPPLPLPSVQGSFSQDMKLISYNSRTPGKIRDNPISIPNLRLSVFCFLKFIRTLREVSIKGRRKASGFFMHNEMCRTRRKDNFLEFTLQVT